MAEFCVHALLIGGDVAATIVLGWGIIWEGPEQSARRHKIARWLVMGSIAAETFFSVSLFAYDESISQAQQLKIISLEKRLLPRNLDNKAQERVSKRICRFGPEQFNVLYIDSGEALFAPELIHTLELCEWRSIGGVDVDTGVKIGSDAIGIELVYDSAHPEFGDVAKEVVKALNDEDILASAVPITGIKQQYSSNIIIVFGRR